MKWFLYTTGGAIITSAVAWIFGIMSTIIELIMNFFRWFGSSTYIPIWLLFILSVLSFLTIISVIRYFIRRNLPKTPKTYGPDQNGVIWQINTLGDTRPHCPDCGLELTNLKRENIYPFRYTCQNPECDYTGSSSENSERHRKALVKNMIRDGILKEKR